MEQQLYDLPAGWEWKDLRNAARIGAERGFVPEIENGKAAFIGMSDIDQDTGLNSAYELRDFERVRKGYTKFQKNAVLLAKITPCTENNKTALIQNIEGGYATTEVYPIHPLSETYPEYLLQFLRSPSVRTYLVAKMEGATGRQRVPTDAVSSLQFPLPPLDEQKRIIAKLDALFTRIDTTITQFQEILELTKALFASALDEAFDGDDQVRRVVVKEISKRIQYGHTAKARETGNAHFLRITDIQNGSVDWQQVPYVSITERDIEKYCLNAYDIVFARSGATSGKSFLISSAPNNAIFASYLIRLVPDREVVVPEFLYFYFQSPEYWNQVAANTSGAAQPNINGTKLGAFQIPLPSLDEQRHIVIYLDDLSERTRALEATTKEKLNTLIALKASLLDAAFRGQI